MSGIPRPPHKPNKDRDCYRSLFKIIYGIPITVLTKLDSGIWYIHHGAKLKAKIPTYYWNNHV